MATSTQQTTEPTIRSYDADASKLKLEEYTKTEMLGLLDSDDFFNVHKDLLNYYPYIAKNTVPEVLWWEIWNGRWWLRTGLLVGTTINNMAFGTIALPFAAGYGLLRGASKLFKWAREKCFDNLHFDDGFVTGVLSACIAAVGAVSWAVEKTTKWIGKGFKALAIIPLWFAKKINRKMIGTVDPLTKSDDLKKEKIKELDNLAKTQQKEKEKLQEIGKKIDELKKYFDKLEKANDGIENSSFSNDLEKTKKETLEKIEELKKEYTEHKRIFDETGKKIKNLGNNKKQSNAKNFVNNHKGESAQPISQYR